jgi:hypothetical protein
MIKISKQQKTSFVWAKQNVIGQTFIAWSNIFFFAKKNVSLE